MSAYLAYCSRTASISFSMSLSRSRVSWPAVPSPGMYSIVKVVGMQALMLWRHPSRGMVSPVDFIWIAEETRLILPIGRWVLPEACRQAREWRRCYPGIPAMEMCVNVSSRQLAHPELVADVAGVLGETGLDPRSLVLEITESAVMEDAERNVATLHELRALGVRIATDDFGPGTRAWRTCTASRWMCSRSTAPSSMGLGGNQRTRRSCGRRKSALSI